MDWRTLFMVEHQQVHAQIPSGDDSDFHLPDILIANMSEEQLRLTPRDDQNSVVWLLWHIARCEDVVGGAILSRAGQVLDERWAVEMGVARRDIGTGMTPSEVRDLSQRIDIGALLEYRSAVGRRTRELVEHLDDRALDEPVTAGDVSAVRALGTFGPHAGWVGDLWQTKPKGWFLWLATGHCYQHLGEAFTLRTMIGGHWAP
jgi:hypothetical protein